MQFRFLGATGGQITGSCTHFKYERRDVQFLVDCGLVQGEGDDFEKNSRPFPFDPWEINFVLLTHAHQDHCGLIPKLYRDGFKGKVICTKATAQLATISLLDSAKQPNNVFSEDDVKAIRYEYIDERDKFGLSKMLPIGDDLFASFSRSAHIIGSASITVGWVKEDGDRAYLVMSGDLGNNTKENQYQPLLAGRQGIFSYPETIVVESTYGGRIRVKESSDFDGRIELLRKIIQTEVFDKKSLLIIPAFSLQRTQELLFDLHLVLSRHFSTDTESTAPFYPLNDFYDDFEDDSWNHTVQKALSSAIASLKPKLQQQWKDSIVVPADKGTRFRLTESAVFSIDDIKRLLLEGRHTYPVQVVLDSPLARKMSSVFREELCRRQKKTPSETVYRNRFMVERFNRDSEDHLDILVKTLLPIDDGENVRVSSGIHEIRYEIGFKTPRPSELLDTGCILLTGGGMCNGGPVIEHFKKTIRAKRRTVVLANGYMAAGTLGGDIQAVCQAKSIGSPLPKEPLQVGDETVAPEDVTLEMIQLQGFYSGHADQAGVLDFVFKVVGSESDMPDSKSAIVFINHGSNLARKKLSEGIKDRALAKLKGDRPIAFVEIPDDQMQWYDLESKQWLAPVVETRTDALLLSLISEQRKTNSLIQRLIDQKGSAGFVKSPFKGEKAKL